MLRTLSLLSIFALQLISSLGLSSSKAAHEQSQLKGIQILVIEKGGQEKTEGNAFV